VPGIYINDGGATSSALGNVLGNIATNLGPEAAAKAQLLREQTEQADWNNRLLSSQVPASEAAAGDASGLLSTFGANAQPPGAGGSVASTAASLAQPPTIDTGQSTRGSAARGVVNTSSMSPLARLVANEILAGRGTSATTALVPLGQQAVSGPGSDYATQAEIVKAKAVPYDTTVGTTHHVPGGALPETTTSGGDPGQQAADAAQLAADQKDADQRVERANIATTNEETLLTAKQMYAKLVGVTDTRSVLSDAFIAQLARASGVPINQLYAPAMAKLAIKRLLKTTVGNAYQAVQGDLANPARNILQQANEAVADPDSMDDATFNTSIDQMLKVAQEQREEGAPARTFQSLPKTAENSRSYHAQLEALRQQREAANAKAREGGASDSGGGGGGQVYVFPDEASMEAAGKAGNVPIGARVQLGYGPQAQMGTYQPKK
jgi:hypothetical protein